MAIRSLSTFSDDRQVYTLLTGEFQLSGVWQIHWQGRGGPLDIDTDIDTDRDTDRDRQRQVIIIYF